MNIKFCVFFILAVSLLFTPATGFSQDTIPDLEGNEVKVRPIRIGVKVGFPNLIGGNLEYVTPLLGKKLAVNADYSKIKSDWLLKGEAREGMDDQEEINYSYLDLGLNYYFFRPGKGLYGGIGYNTISAEATMVSSDRVEYIKEKHSSLNVKLGAKLGGLFYFRPEIGYSFDPLPKQYDVLIVNNDGTRETRTDDWSGFSGPADILFQGFMANIGFGFAF